MTPEQDGGFVVHIQAPRNVRDLALFTLVAAATLVVVDRLLWTPDTILVVWIGGGVVAGCCVVLPPRRWWLVLVPYAVTAAAAVHLIGMPWAMSAVAGLLELVSILAYVAVVRRHPSDRTGLGADLLWVSLGLTAADLLRELTDTGVRVAIDDFGTGYAGLSSFRSLPASIVKIDRVFIASMLGRREDLDLVHSIIDLAHRFGKRVVAEGVETQEEYEALRGMDCDLVQGWLTGRPVPFADVPLPHIPTDGHRRRERPTAGTGRHA